MAKALTIRPLAVVGVLGVVAALMFGSGGRGGDRVFAAPSPVAAPAGQINFNRDIRPIFSDRCFACHGPDANKRQSGLRLDKQAGLFDELPKHVGKRAFVPGKPELSYAYQRMISTDSKEVMPPITVPHLKVSAREKELVRKWIEQGAKWQEHWAFVKPVRPELPKVANEAWARNEIDRFVLARLEQEGLKPAAEVDKDTLIRRVSLDLTGLPPTLAEVDAFEKDTAPDAYEKVVDRLLASPHYGEQMAVAWLDAARFADSHGFQSDPERFMHHWRDWVINAYNANMPFDQFAVEQIAGDLLPNATESQKIATGFNRNHRANSEGGIIDEEWRVETVIDRVETTSQTFLALTMGCCRCHDHKYDSVTQKEFYEFSAYFNSINERGEYFSVGLDRGKNAEPIMKVFAAAQKEQLARLKEAVAAADARVAEFQTRLPEYEKKYVEAGVKAPDPDGLALRFALDEKVEGVGADGKPVAAKFDGKAGPAWVDAKLAKGLKFDGAGASVDAGQAVDFERTDAFSFGAWVNLQGGDGSILNKMSEGPAFQGFDLFLQEGGKVAPHVVNKWSDNAIKVVTAKAVPMNQWAHVMVTYDGSSKAAGVKVYVDGVRQETKVDQDKLRGSIKTKSPLLIGKRVTSSPLNGTVDDVRFYKRALTDEEVARLGVGPDLDELVKVEPAKRTPEQKAKLTGALLAGVPEYVEATAARDKATQDADKIDKDPRNTTMVMEELPKPRDTFVLNRGEYDKHGEKVEPGVPAILPPLPKDAPKNRLALARWIVDDANPLTARVQANRLWEKFFGVGLVKTSENFGAQAEWPSHPELLDWLATEMVAKKWDLKAFQKLIVTSATYRQAAHVTPELMERDPENRLLARGPRFRLSGEQVRDQALAVSGLLVEKVGGPSVKPYQPANLWEGNLYGNLVKYDEDKGEGLYRRSLYTFIKRTANPVNLSVFDMPSREYCVVKRSRTNTPLQALDVMNDPTFVEAARVLAERMMTDGGGTAAERIEYGFRRATGRKPSEAERKILEEELAGQLERYKKDAEAAKKLVAVGAAEPNVKLDPPELAAYTMAASTILNLDEMVNKP
jgi:hypothetical protein